MKRKWIKSVAILCATALFAETFSGFGPLVAHAAASDYIGMSNQYLDAGGFKTEPYGTMTDDWTQHWYNRADVLPKLSDTYLTDNYREEIATVPTSDWASSVVFDKFSESLYVHPMAFRATSVGMEMANPAVVDVINGTDNEPAVESLLKDSSVELVMGGEGFTAVDARIDAQSDWTYDISMKNSAGTSEILTTLAKGSPYVYYRFTEVTPTISLGGGATNLAIYKNSTSSNSIGVSLTNTTDGSTHYYGIFASSGATWTNSGGKLTANLPDGREWITIAALPDETAETFELYETYAANRIYNTIVEWEYSEAASMVTTVYNVITKNLDTGAEGGDTIIALYPHQWRNAVDVSYTGKTYKTIRGTMKTMIGKKFTTEMTYNGILAAMPTPASEEGLGTLKDQISYFWDYYQNTCNDTWNQTAGSETQYGGYDTYWLGKNLNFRSDVALMAEQIDDDNEDWRQIKSDIVTAIQDELEYWFNPGDCYTVEANPFITGFFYYYDDFGTLIGYNSSYGTDKQLNDHHFHYGYWVKAAATVAKYAPQYNNGEDWAAEWDALVYEMISDFANPNRDGTSLNAQRPNKTFAEGVETVDTKYPFLRNFDIYEGHSWASGVANYEYDENGEFVDAGLSGGNNQESTSEAINAWSSLILWGEAVGDERIRDLGIYLYTTELATVEEYYFDMYDEVFTDAYESRGNFDIHVVTRLFGGRYDHSAWWTEDPIQVTAIHMIPMTGATLYFAKHKQKVLDTYNSIWGKQWDNYVTLNEQKGWGDVPNLQMHHDLLAEFYALANPEAAMERWIGTIDDEPPLIERGESRAHTYGYIQSMVEFGTPDYSITGSTPLSMAFTKDGTTTYVAQNFSNEDIKVYFSDGTYINVPAGKSYAGAAAGTGENPDLKDKVSYNLEIYLENTARNGYDCVNETGKAEAGEFTLTPAAKEGFTFDEDNAENVLTGTLEEGQNNAVTLKVYYSRNTYSITYELNGGTNAVANPSEYVYGTTVQLAEPTKAGNRFLGWFTNAECTQPFTGITTTTTGAVSVYAGWISETSASYTTEVYMQNTGRTGYDLVETKNVIGEIGQNVNVAYTGDTTGFTLNAEKSTQSGTVLEDNSLVLSVYYDRNTYGVTYGNMDGATNAYGNAATYVYGVGLTLVAPTKEGYSFGGWFTDEACTAGNEITAISTSDTEAQTVYAKWTETPEASGEAGDTNNPHNDVVVSYNEETKHVTISINRSGITGLICYVAKYTDGATAKADAAAATQTFNPGTLTAQHWGVTFTPTDAGASKEITEFTIDPGEYIVFALKINESLTADSGFYYYKVGGGASTTSYTVNHYKQNVALSGYELADTSTVSNVNAGDTANATSNTYDGFTYDGTNSTASGTIQPDGSLSLNLYYNRNSYAITYGNMDDATNAASNTATYVYGVGLTLAAPTKTGYDFGGWYTDANCTAGSEIEAIGTTQTGPVTVYAKWVTPSEPEKNANYTVKYYKQNLALDDYDEVTADGYTTSGVVGNTATANAKSYTGFAVNATASTQSGTILEDGSLVLKVYYDRIKYGITYHNVEDAENPAANATQYVYGIGLTLSNPTKSGYTFVGWYTDSACTDANKVTEISTTATGNYDLYAKWEEETDNVATYTVHYFVQNTTLDGYIELTDEKESFDVEPGTAVEAEIKDLVGFTHDTDAEGNVLSGTATDGLQLKVYYDRNSYTVIYENVKEGENPASNKSSYVYGVGLTLASPARDGYAFEGWYTSADCASESRVTAISTTQTGTVTLYAKWGSEIYAAKYTVEYYLQNTTLDDYVKVEEDTTFAYGEIGQKVDADIKEYTGFTYNSKVKGSVVSGTVTEDNSLVLKVYYDRNVYQITYKNVLGAQFVEKAPTEYVYGVGVTLQAATKSGYKFKGWYTDRNFNENSKLSSISGSYLGDVTVYAKWVAIDAYYQVKYYLQNLNLDGYVEVTADAQRIQAETGETVTAEKKEYTGFIYNEAASNATGTVESDNSLVLKLYYDRIQYKINYHNMNGATNHKDNAATYLYNQGMTLKTPTKEGYVFAGWYLDEALTEANKIAEIGVSSTGDIDVYAKWIDAATAATYKVEYYLQNVNLDAYDMVADATIEMYGTIGETVSAPAKEFFGYTKNSEVEGACESGTVAEDNSLVLKVYYNRTKYTVVYNNMAGATNPNAEQYVYGIGMTLETPVKEGYTFKGWFTSEDLAEDKQITEISAEQTGNVEVWAKWISKSELVWSVEEIRDYDYTGKKITPNVIVRDNETGHKLQVKKDYTVKYENNLNAGTATITISGKGNYTGVRYITFEILPINIGEDETVIADDIYKFANANGKPVKMSPVVKWGTKKLKLNKDFKIDTSVDGSQTSYTAVGKYDLVLTGMGNYTGSLTIKAVLADKNSTVLISKAKVENVVAKNYVAGTNEYVQENLRLTYKEYTLQEGTDYEVVYRNNTQAGTAELIIKGLDEGTSYKFTGSKTIKFKIVGQKLTAKMITFDQESYTYRGYAIEPAVRVLGVDEENYTVTYSNNLNAGKGTAIVKGINGYEGIVKKTFKITPLEVTTASVDINVETPVTFVKGGAQAGVTVTYNGEVLSENVDYTLKYTNNKAVGAATVSVIGKGNFGGKIDKPFNIDKQSLSEVTVLAADIAYNPKKNMKYYLAKPVVLDKDGNKLVAGKDYLKVVKYELLLEDGTYQTINESSSVALMTVGSEIRVTVTGTGNYGEVNDETTYRIIEASKDIKGARINIKPQTYTGKAVTITEDDIVSVEVKVNGSYITLDKGDYEIVEGSYKNNIKKGNAKVTIRGVGDWGGLKEASFKIQSKSVEETFFLADLLKRLLGIK